MRYAKLIIQPGITMYHSQYSIVHCGLCALCLCGNTWQEWGDDMRTRQKSLVDFGVYPEDINRLKDICQKATPEQRHDILHCCISSCPPGIELLVYESIVTNKSYDRIMKTKYIPAKRDDFYAYKRKAMAMFYDTLRKLREI